MAKKQESYRSSTRITEKDIFRGVTSVKTQKATGNLPREVVVYTLKGLSKKKDDDGNFIVEKEEDVNAFAKKSTNGDAERYYVKSDGKNLLNPVGMYSISERGREKVPGLVRWTYRQVNKNAFVSYLRFLRTKNQIHLNHAERENI